MNALILKNYIAPEVEISEEAFTLRSEAIRQANKITAVTSLPMEELAVEALKKVQFAIRGVEKSRKDLKSKPLETGRDIDRKAEEYSAPLVEVESKLKQALGGYAELKRQEALEEERIRQKEIQRQLDLQREQERKAEAAARAQALAEETERRMLEQAAAATNEKQRIIAEQAAKRARELAEQEAQKLAQAAMEAQKKEDAIRESLPVVATKVSGSSTKFILKYRVTDIKKLYAAHPNTCELTDKKSSVNMLIGAMSMQNPDVLPVIPGIEVYRQADVTTISR